MKANKILSTTIPIVFAIMFLVLPVFELIALISGLDFVLYSEKAICITQAALSLAATVTIFVLKPKLRAPDRVLLIIDAPLALLNALCLANGEWGLTILFAIISAACVFLLYFKLIPDSNGKAASAVISVILVIAVAVLYVWGLIHGAFIDKRVLKAEYTSINGTYVAQLGTSESLISTKTTVYVSKSDAEFGVLFGCYRQKPVLIYEGEDYEVKTAVLSWLDDSTLIVNDQEYSVMNEE